MTRSPVLAAALVSALGLAACSSGDMGMLDPSASLLSGSTRVGPAEVDHSLATASIGSPVGGIGGAVGTATVTLPAGGDREAAAARFFGAWTLASAGARGCVVRFGSANAVGDYTAATRRCETLPLARVALWTPVDDGVVVFDFERRPIVALASAGPGVYEGRLADGTPVTLFR